MNIEGVMNYTGSKFKLLDQILPFFDYSKSNFIDLFVGGGSVFINVLEKYDNIYINDIISDIVDIYHQLSINDDIINKTKIMCLTLKDSQIDYLNIRDDYNKNKSSDKLWSLILSCNSNLIRFNKKGKFNQTWGKRSWNSNTDKKVNLFKDRLRNHKDKIVFNSMNFNLFPLIKNSFYYLDPPYAYTKDSKGNMSNEQISEAGYNSFYYKDDDLNLYKYCHKINEIGSTFMISGVLHHGDKTSWILDKLKCDGFKCIELNYNYDKINKSGLNKKTTEVIIMNY